MSILEKLSLKAKEHPMRVAFPEGENEKMMQAAYECALEGAISAILVGDTEKLKDLASERGLDPEKFTYADLADEIIIADVIAKYTALPDTRLKEKALRRRMADPLYYAMVMQAAGEADVTFAGINYTTEDVLLAGLMLF